MIGPDIRCYRCGVVGYVEWIDMGTFSDPESIIRGREWCVTPGCTDEDGSRRLEPLTPEEMRRRADEAWMRSQRALLEDR